MPKIRTFVAINLNTELKGEVEQVMQEFSHIREVRWLNSQQIHLTLKFLGGVEEGRLDEVFTGVERAALGCRPFEMSLRGLGVFPNLRRPRVVWVGVRTESDHLTRLAEDVDKTLAELGFPREERTFRPHITLGRVGKQLATASELSRVVEERADLSVGNMLVERVSVMKSTLSPQGAIYDQLKGFDL